MKEQNKEYKERLISYGYTEEEATEAITFRDSCEHMPWEMYQMLFEQKQLIRKCKLKKIRNLYVDEESNIWYLNHFNRKFQIMAEFKSEE